MTGPQMTGTGQMMLDVIMGRRANPFVELEGQPYLQFDEIMAEGVTFRLRWQGEDVLTFPLDEGPLHQLVMLKLVGGGLIKVNSCGT